MLVVVGLEAGVDMTTTEEGVIMVSLGSCSSRLGSKVGAVRVSMASNLAHFPSSGNKHNKCTKQRTIINPLLVQFTYNNNINRHYESIPGSRDSRKLQLSTKNLESIHL